MENEFFVDTNVVKKYQGIPTYDSFAIASVIMDISFKGSKCSLKQGPIINDCVNCNLHPICMAVKDLVEEYTKKTTIVRKEFSFNNDKEI